VYRSISRLVEFLARWTAIAGGIVLMAVVIMSCVSIIGRGIGKMGFGIGPIPGDTELVEIGIGFAVFAFLPWCQLRRGHATVDLFHAAFGAKLNRIIDLVADTLMFIAAALIAWRLGLGMIDKKSYSETTWILEIPIWNGYAAGLFGAVVFVIVSAFCVLRSGRQLAGFAND
jgi:TRAP-type C4-dicarboxylate transport system permease small subunit